MKQYSLNIHFALQTLRGELLHLGYLYHRQKKYEEAYACYRLFSDMMEMILGNGGDDIVHYDIPCYNWCAAVCADLGRSDEAMDWLEKWLGHMRLVADRKNAIVESKLPYFYGVDLRRTNMSAAESMTSSLEWDRFDQIRQTDRFQKILADAQAFERGE